MTNVQLTDEQAALFILFMKHYDSIGFMMKNEVFDIKQGSATLNFDREGAILSIDKHLFAYRTKISVHI